VTVGVSVGVAVSVLVLVGVSVDSRSKVAVTCFVLSIARLHASAPEHAPLQPEKREPMPLFAVSVIGVFSSKLAVQVMPHEMPSGSLVTVPLPLPAKCTTASTVVSVCVNKGEPAM
jgi:hypothetical protein